MFRSVSFSSILSRERSSRSIPFCSFPKFPFCSVPFQIIPTFSMASLFLSERWARFLSFCLFLWKNDRSQEQRPALPSACLIQSGFSHVFGVYSKPIEIAWQYPLSIYLSHHPMRDGSLCRGKTLNWNIYFYWNFIEAGPKLVYIDKEELMYLTFF